MGSEELTEQEMELARAKLLTPEYRRFIKSVFNDTLDYLISSSKDGKIGELPLTICVIPM
jgi:hypothetical protein